MSSKPTRPPEERLFEVSEVTWPPADATSFGPWTIRKGAEGGKRVSAATPSAAVSATDIPEAEDAMKALGQTPLFMLKAGDETLDSALDSRGYRIIDPVNIYVCPTSRLLTLPRPPISGFAIWEPLAIMKDIWAAGGIGEGRINVMHRASGPKTGILGRANDRAAGTAFVAQHDSIAMLHALEVAPEFRRQGVGRIMMGHAAHWAAAHGADYFSVLVTAENSAANALYASLGMEAVAHYFYRTV